MALSNYVLKEKDVKNAYSQILCELYAMKDLHKLRAYCIKHGYKMAYCFHEKEDETKKEHIHALIKSDRKHRFNVSTLISETLKPYNFMKCDTTIQEFITYVMHLEYDFKKKYNFEHIQFLNVSYDSQKKYRWSVEARPISEIEEGDLYSPEELERLMFKGYFKNFQQIIDYCNHNAKLRRYLTFHCHQIRETFYICFNGKQVKTEDETMDEYYYKYNTNIGA